VRPVPCYLNQVGCPSGSKFNLGAAGLPHQTPGNFYTANFTCNIPQSAVHEQTPGAGDWQVVHPDRTSMYGHGLFGDPGEVHTTNVRQLGDGHSVITCATDFIGMAEEDVIPEAVPALRDLSNFPPLPDRLQQGLLDFIYLGRLMSLADGFASDPAFKFGGQSAIDTSRGPPPDRGVHQPAGQDHRPLRQLPLLRGGLDRPAVGHARPRVPASSR
jgi:hypothetical protein